MKRILGHILRIPKTLLGIPEREFVGRDHLGNTYYTVTVNNRKQRVFQNAQSDIDSVPPAWKAWMSGNRDHPPEDHEVVGVGDQAAERKRSVIQRLDHASAPGLDPATARENLKEPKTRGDSFEPGQWLPEEEKTKDTTVRVSPFLTSTKRAMNNESEKSAMPSKMLDSKTKQTDEANNDEQSFQPESWSPGGSK